MNDARVAAIYTRISDDRLGDAAGVARQEADCRRLAERRGWIVSDEEFIENDTSAFHRSRVKLPDGTTALRVNRPAFRRLLDAIASGAVNAVVVYDLDRVARDPRDLEDLIDVVESRRVPTASVTGSLDLSNDTGITVARINVAIANKSSRDTSRRVARKHLELAESGKVGGGGIRSYGYDRDGLTVIEDEATVLREIAGRMLTGDSLRAIAKDLTQRGVPTVKGAAWHARSVHSVIAKPRVAGLREHRGEIVGDAVWPAIIDRDTWERVRGALAARAGGATNSLVRWLTGTLRCGECEHALTGSVSRGGHRYWCATTNGGCGKIAVTAEKTEDHVERLILAYLARPDVVKQLTATVAARNLDSTREEAADDEAQLKELARMWGAKKITMAEYLAARGEIEGRLQRWETLMRASAPQALRGLLEAKEVPAHWARLAPSDKREVARILFPSGIEVVASARGTFTFDTSRIQPTDWNTK